MAKWLAVCACFLCTIQCVDKAIGDAVSRPIPDEYRWVWFLVAIGWVSITYRAAVELQVTPESRRGA